MSVFEELYSDYYDIMYADKAYDAEAVYVQRALSMLGVPSGRMLSLGAGTLNYEKRFIPTFRIKAIDISPHMIALASKKVEEEHLAGIELAVGDMRYLNEVPQSYDAAVSLFNVVSYCENLEDMGLLFRGVSAALKPGGGFLFDCWNARAIDNDPPMSRWKRFKNGDRELLRLTEAIPRGEGHVDITVTLLELSGDRIVRRSEERHFVRGWVQGDLERLGNQSGFSLVHASEFPSWDRPVNDQTWSMALVFKKNQKVPAL